MAGNSRKGFHLVPEEEGAAPPPVPLPQGIGKPPAKPPAAPPLASEPLPEPKNDLAARVKQLEQENDQLLCALYHYQQEVKELRSSK